MATGKSSSGGALQRGVVELDVCQNVCRDREECAGFDWTLASTATKRCWLFLDDVLMETKIDNAGAAQYTRRSCGKY